MNIYCPRCEAVNDEDADVCSLCGHQLKRLDRSPPFSGRDLLRNLPTRRNQRARDGARFSWTNVAIWAVGGVGVLFILGLVGHYVFSEGSGARNRSSRVPIQRSSASPGPSVGSRRSKLIDFTVIKREEFLDYKVSYDVRVGLADGRLPTKEELAAVSRYLHSKEKKHERTFVSFYLPGMKVDAGAFATAHYNPTLEVKVLEHMIPEKYQRLRKNKLGNQLLAKQPPLEASTATLNAAYRANKADADRRYKGRTLLVSGLVREVGEGADWGISLKMDDGVLCMFPRSQIRSVRELRPGMSCKVRGVCIGSTIGVALDDCRLVPGR